MLNALRVCSGAILDLCEIGGRVRRGLTGVPPTSEGFLPLPKAAAEPGASGGPTEGEAQQTGVVSPEAEVAKKEAPEKKEDKKEKKHKDKGKKEKKRRSPSVDKGSASAGVGDSPGKSKKVKEEFEKEEDQATGVVDLPEEPNREAEEHTEEVPEEEVAEEGPEDIDSYVSRHGREHGLYGLPRREGPGSRASGSRPYHVRRPPEPPGPPPGYNRGERYRDRSRSPVARHRPKKNKGAGHRQRGQNWRRRFTPNQWRPRQR